MLCLYWWVSWFWKHHKFLCNINFMILTTIQSYNFQASIAIAPLSQNIVAYKIFFTQTKKTTHRPPITAANFKCKKWMGLKVMWDFPNCPFLERPHTGHFPFPIAVSPPVIWGYWPSLKALDEKCCASLNYISTRHTQRQTQLEAPLIILFSLRLLFPIK